MGGISLTASMRANLSSIQGTNSLLDLTQKRLSTGLKVSSAVDGPASYFTARSLTNSANDISARLDGMGQSQQVLEAASKASEALSKLLDQVQSAIDTARADVSGVTTDNLGLQGAQILSVLAQIGNQISDAGYNGTNLMAAGNSMTVNFNAAGTSNIVVAAADYSTKLTALLSVATVAISSVGCLATADAGVKAAKTYVESQAKIFGSNLATIQTRQDFAKGMVDVLKTGADKLTLADMSEEGANMLALQTRSQLGIQSLSMASQNAQSVLQLFR